MLFKDNHVVSYCENIISQLLYNAKSCSFLVALSLYNLGSVQAVG